MVRRMDRTKNTLRNIIWGMLNKFITLLFPFILRSFIIRKLGSEYLGLSSLFTSILQVLNLTEMDLVVQLFLVCINQLLKMILKLYVL